MRKKYIFIALASLCLENRGLKSLKAEKIKLKILRDNLSLCITLGLQEHAIFQNLAGSNVKNSALALLSRSEIRLEKLKRKILQCAAIPVLICCLSNTIKAQENPQSERLIIGDKVPDMVFTTVLNYKDSTLHFSQLRGKAVLLDFWATYCSACLKEFPKMDLLQREYTKNLQIILMNAFTEDTKTILQDFLKERINTPKGFSMPVVQYSETTSKIFPIKSMPHYIWIGADGRIKAITRADQVTAANIERLIAGLSLNLKLKKD